MSAALCCVVLLMLYHILLHHVLLCHIVVVHVYFHLLCYARVYCTVCQNNTWHYTIKQLQSHEIMFHMATLQLQH